MEAESIIYFHPAEGPANKNAAAKRHWWQDVSLQGRILRPEDAGGFFIPIDCPVPPFYYKKKPWPQERLDEAMERVLDSASGMADAFLHPHIMTYMSEKYANRWETRSETMEKLFSCLLAVYAADCLHRKGEVTVLLGKAEETEWQMEMTERLLLPYLPRINRLLFYYEEVEGTDIWEEEAAALEAYSYGYGLVPRMLPYGTGKTESRFGRERCAGVVLDYAGTEGMPGMRREEQVIYVDLFSNQAKEQSAASRTGRILYVSPLKYLDTVVKNSYDRKMYATAISRE